MAKKTPSQSDVTEKKRTKKLLNSEHASRNKKMKMQKDNVNAEQRIMSSSNPESQSTSAEKTGCSSKVNEEPASNPIQFSLDMDIFNNPLNFTKQQLDECEAAAAEIAADYSSSSPSCSSSSAQEDSGDDRSPEPSNETYHDNVESSKPDDNTESAKPGISDPVIANNVACKLRSVNRTPKDKKIKDEQTETPTASGFVVSTSKKIEVHSVTTAQMKLASTADVKQETEAKVTLESGTKLKLASEATFMLQSGTRVKLLSGAEVKVVSGAIALIVSEVGVKPKVIAELKTVSTAESKEEQTDKPSKTSPSWFSLSTWNLDSSITNPLQFSPHQQAECQAKVADIRKQLGSGSNTDTSSSAESISSGESTGKVETGSNAESLQQLEEEPNSQSLSDMLKFAAQQLAECEALLAATSQRIQSDSSSSRSISEEDCASTDLLSAARSSTSTTTLRTRSRSSANSSTSPSPSSSKSSRSSIENVKSKASLATDTAQGSNSSSDSLDRLINPLKFTAKQLAECETMLAAATQQLKSVSSSSNTSSSEEDCPARDCRATKSVNPSRTSSTASKSSSASASKHHRSGTSSTSSSSASATSEADNRTSSADDNSDEDTSPLKTMIESKEASRRPQRTGLKRNDVPITVPRCQRKRKPDASDKDMVGNTKMIRRLNTDLKNDNCIKVSNSQKNEYKDTCRKQKRNNGKVTVTQCEESAIPQCSSQRRKRSKTASGSPNNTKRRLKRLQEDRGDSDGECHTAKKRVH